MTKRGSSGLSLLLAIDKPKGMTSHDVVNRVRRVFGEKRVGHMGTLDPLASGVLCVAVGPATRLDAFMSGHNKTYVMDIAFGCATTTDDAEGEVISRGEAPSDLLNEQIAREVVASLVGKGKQLPPVYSAVKVNGQKSYAAARKGNVIDLKPRDFEVLSATLLSVEKKQLGELLPAVQEGSELVPVWRVSMEVSGGTYMRSIARDLGKRIGCGAFVSELRRSALDAVSIEECISLEYLETFEGDPASIAVDPLRMLPYRYAFVRDTELVRKIDNGAPITPANLSLNIPLTHIAHDDFCCTTQVFPSSDPCFEGETVALLVDNHIKALYRFDESKGQLCAQCIFSLGVERGSNL